MALPTNSNHLSRPGQDGGTGAYDQLFIDEYGGLVDVAFHESSMMRNVVNVRTVRGTNTVTNYRVGDTSLIGITPGVRPDASPTNFGDVSVVVDTIVTARNNVALLEDLQINYDAKVELAQGQGRLLGEYFDEAVYIQGVKAARSAAPANMPGFEGGTSISTTGAGSDLDPVKVDAGILSLIQSMIEKKVKVNGNQFGTNGYDGVCVYVAPAQYFTLLKNEKLVNADYSGGNANYADGMVLKAAGVPIKMTTLLPNKAQSGHILSNATNGNAYNVSAAEAKVIALAMAPRAVLVGETIGLDSDIWYNREEKMWFIDSHLSFGVAPDRFEMAAVLNKP